MNKFEEKINDALHKNTPDILDSIKQSNRFFVPEKDQKRSFLDIFKLKGVQYSLVSAFMLVILAVFMINGNVDNQVYASTVTLDINPQIEITLDEDDRVMTIVGLNDDGDEFLNKDISYKKMSLDEVLELVVDTLERKGYIVSTEDNVILIHVEGVNESVQQRVKDKLENKLKNETDKLGIPMKFIKTNDITLTRTEIAEIQRLSKRHGIHPGRMILIYQINEVDSTYSIRDLHKLKTRELHDLYETLITEEPTNE